MSFLVKNDLLLLRESLFKVPSFSLFFFGVENEGGGTLGRLDETFFAFALHNNDVIIIVVVVLFFVASVVSCLFFVSFKSSCVVRWGQKRCKKNRERKKYAKNLR